MPRSTDEARAAWRARREERRAKQRAQNLVRARAMHEARRDYEHHPARVQETRTFSARPQIHIGCSGWFYWHWRDGFYPPDLPSSRWFEHYASRFETVELNAPFYSWPTLATISKWNRQVGRRRFTMPSR
jgi:hypothetical protein